MKSTDYKSLFNNGIIAAIYVTAMYSKIMFILAVGLTILLLISVVSLLSDSDKIKLIDISKTTSVILHIMWTGSAIVMPVIFHHYELALFNFLVYVGICILAVVVKEEEKENDHD